MHSWAVRRLARRWWNLLAVLQVAAGVAAITAIGSTVLPVLWQGDDGPQILTVRYERELNEPGIGKVISSEPIFRYEDLELLKSELPGVVAAAEAPESAYQVEVEVEGRRYIVQRVARVGPDYLKLLGVSPVEGSFFTDDDFRQAAADPSGTVKSVVISRELARVLFGNEPATGKTITLPTRAGKTELAGAASSLAHGSVQVIGVVEMPPLRDRYAFFEVYADLLFPSPRAVGGSGTTAAGIGTFYVRTRTGEIEKARREIIATLLPLIRQRETKEPVPGGGVGPSVLLLSGGAAVADQTPDTSPETSSGSTPPPSSDPVPPPPQQPQPSQPSQPPQLPPGEIRVETPQAWAVEAATTGGLYLGSMAMIALIVSGIALFTVTLVNLAEQRHSIGLRRALGASRGSILRETVAEAIVLAGTGGVLGVALSEPVGRFLLQTLLWTARSPLASSSPWRLSAYFDVRAAVLGLLLALVVGVVAVLYPGWESSRLQPVEAFRDGR